MRPGQLQEIHGSCRDNQGMGGIKTPGNADNHIMNARCFQAFGQSLDLDVVGLIAALITFGRIGRDVGKAGIQPAQQDFFFNRIDGERYLAEGRQPVPVGAGVLSETCHPHSVLRQTV